MLERQRMKNITIALPNIFVDNIEKLQVLGLVPSRSEAIRLAIREFLKKEVNVVNLLGFRDEKQKFDEIEEITIYELLLSILEQNSCDLDQISMKVPSEPRKELFEALTELQAEGLVTKNGQNWVKVTE